MVTGCTQYLCKPNKQTKEATILLGQTQCVKDRVPFQGYQELAALATAAYDIHGSYHNFIRP